MDSSTKSAKPGLLFFEFFAISRGHSFWLRAYHDTAPAEPDRADSDGRAPRLSRGQAMEEPPLAAIPGYYSNTISSGSGVVINAGYTSGNFSPMAPGMVGPPPKSPRLKSLS